MTSLFSTPLLTISSTVIAVLGVCLVFRARPKGTETASFELASARNEYYRTMLQILGGMFLLAGVFQAAAGLRISEEGRWSDRYRTGLELLGKNHPSERVAGMRFLEKLAKDSVEYRIVVIGVLCSSLGKEPEKQPTGVVACADASFVPVHEALAILAGLSADIYPNSKLNLRGAHLECARAAGINLQEADLDNASFLYADLSGIHLENSVAKGATFDYANLRGAHLNNAKLHSAGMRDCILDDAVLSGTELNDATLYFVNDRPDMARREKIAKALRETKGDSNTKLDPDIERPAQWGAAAPTGNE